MGTHRRPNKQHLLGDQRPPDIAPTTSSPFNCPLPFIEDTSALLNDSSDVPRTALQCVERSLGLTANCFSSHPATSTNFDHLLNRQPNKQLLQGLLFASIKPPVFASPL